MTRLLIDTSVLIKWFHSEGESELEPARALRSAHITDDLDAHMLDLAPYEVGNVLSRALRWTATDVADQLDDLHAILGPPLVMTPAWLRVAATLAHLTNCPSTTPAGLRQQLSWEYRWSASTAGSSMPAWPSHRVRSPPASGCGELTH